MVFKNYFKIAIRNILRYKGYSFINIAGLAIGMACTILIMLWVQDVLSYDKFQKNINNLYRAYQKFEYSGNRTFYTDNTCGPLAAELKSVFPEVKKTARFLPGGNKPVRYGDECFDEYICYADSSFFEMFTFPLIMGKKESALKNRSSIVITEEMAKKYFGGENPMGKTLTLDGKFDFKVTGVLKDIPYNTHLYYVDFVVPFSQADKLLSGDFDSWGRNWPKTYVLLKDGTSYKEFEKKISGIIKKHQTKSTSTLFLQPLARINLYSLSGEGEYIIYIYIFSIIAFFILLIACINFMNISTARSQNRVKEIGLRKVSGARKSNIIYQFFGESILLSFIALLFAIILVELFLPIFNNISGQKMALYFIGNRSLLLLVFGVALVTGILSGTYPAFYLSSFQPGKVLKGTFQTGPKSSAFRNILVVIQFSASIFLIISTLIIYNQMEFIRNRDLGYNNNHLVYMNLKGDSLKNYKSLKTELLKNPGISHVTASTKVPVSGGDSTPDNDWEGKDPNVSVMMNRIYVDYDYLKTMEMEIASGRDFLTKKTNGKDNSAEYILNEEAIRRMGIESPIGKKFKTGGIEGTIVGVVKDFHFASLHEEIEPMVICAFPKIADIIFVRINTREVSQVIRHVESTWKKINQSIPFSYDFLDRTINNLYNTEQQVVKLFNYFTFLAIFIACLGLFGLASFTIQQRTKEIGIRKVLGASVPGIVALLSKALTKWILLANIFAWPVAYYFMSKWLSNFAYRIDIGIWTFLLAGTLVLIIALLTVGYQSIRSSVANPVEALRYE